MGDPHGDGEVKSISATARSDSDLGSTGRFFRKKSLRYAPRDLHGGLARPLGVLLAFSHQKWSGAGGHFGAGPAIRRNVRLPCPEDI